MQYLQYQCRYDSCQAQHHELRNVCVGATELSRLPGFVSCETMGTRRRPRVDRLSYLMMSWYLLASSFQNLATKQTDKSVFFSPQIQCLLFLICYAWIKSVGCSSEYRLQVTCPCNLFHTTYATVLLFNRILYIPFDFLIMTGVF